jgi:hypothetical protein
MKTRIIKSATKNLVFLLILFSSLNLFAANVTSVTSGNWSNPSTWSIISRTTNGTITTSTNSKTVTGTSLASFTTTLRAGNQILNTSNVVIGTVASIESNTSLTLVANASSTMNAGWNSRGVVSIDAVTISSGHTITVDANYTCASLTFAIASSNSTLNINDNCTLTSTGTVNMQTPNTNITSTLNINNGTLNCNTLITSGTIATRKTNINITNGTLDITSNYTSTNSSGTTISISGAGKLYFGGTVSSNFTLNPGSSSTITYDGSSTQTCKSATYYNLVISNAGVKTVTGSTVNNNFQIEGTASIGQSITYGTNAKLIYNTSSNRTVSSFEWPNSFSPTGGVQISNTGIITLNASKSLNTDAELTIDVGSSLVTSNYSLTFNGDFINNGNFNAGSSSIEITGNQMNQYIGKLTTTSTITFSKTTGTASFTGDVSADLLTLNSGNGILNLGSSVFSHQFNSIRLTNNTLNGGNSITNITSVFSKTNGIFIPGNSTINFTNVSPQIEVGDYYNLILSGSGTYVLPALNVSSDFTIKGSVNFTTTADVLVDGNMNVEEMGVFTCSANSLTINGNLIIGDDLESESFFNISSIVGTKTIHQDFTIKAGGTFSNYINEDVTIGGNFDNNWTSELGSGKYTFTGTNKTINSTNALTFKNLEIIGSITNLITITLQEVLSGTGSLINSGTIYFTGNQNHSISLLDAYSNPNSVNYISSTSHNIINTDYYHLEISGTGNHIISSDIDIIGNFTISGDAILSLNTNLFVGGDFTINSNGKFNFASNVICTFSGNITNSGFGIMDFSNGTVHLNGNSSQSILNEVSNENLFYNLILSGNGIKTFWKKNTINSSLLLNAGTQLQIGNSSTLNLNCSVSGTGKILGSSSSINNLTSLEFSKSNDNIGDIYIDNTNRYFNNISVKNNCTVTLDDFGIYNSLILTSGKLIVSNKIDISSSNNTPISKTSGYLEMGSTSTLSFGEINSNSVAFTLPNSLFESTPTFKNINFNRNTNLSLGTNFINLTGTLTITQGNLESNDKLTLKSDANGTARVAAISNTSYGVIGNVNVERFIPGGPGKRKWRFLSFATNDISLMSLTQLIDDILITAPTGAAGGFDINPLNPANTASLRTYTESTTGAASNGWTDPNSINNNIATGVGFEVFVRGSRTLTNPYLNWTEPDNVTIDYTGILNKGDITKTLSYTNTNNSTSDGFNLVGNPYASAIDFESGNLTKTNIQNKFWSYNPNTGLYGIYDATLHTGTNSITQYIASSQGFFVKATAANPSITFKETCKSDNPGNNYFKSNSSSQNILPILKIGVSNDSTFIDETLLVLDENASALGEDEHDAYKWFNDALNIYTLSKDNINLNIDARNYPTAIDTIPLAVFSYNGNEVMTTHHQISFSGLESIPSSTDVVLWDKYLNTYTNCKIYPQYNFMITSDNSSYGKNRFAILIGDVNIGIDNTNFSDKLILYPNPSSSILNITTSSNWDNKTFEYKIIDQSGRIILQDSTSINHQHAEINVSSIHSGIYIIEVISKDSILRRKFIKQ